MLTNNFEVFTFGMNNKGQCGRDFPPGPGPGHNEADEAEDDQDADHEPEIVSAGADIMCPPGKHKWKHDQCMVCTVCGECTGMLQH